ncbi:hypothetical protein AB0D11_02750 [Streptomyces monashensis]|uniref:hypothetical protein n=1 Tax=Streptomyces monashensis TaxID=1678012 RepID=UPI0033CBD6C4
MPEAGLDAAADSLRSWLNSEQFTDLSAVEVTKFFTDSVTRWASGLGYEAQREVRLPDGICRSDGRHGRLDLQLRHPAGKVQPISVEIDRGSKLWSLEKLTHAAELGDLALWLRWSRKPVRVRIPPNVRLIHAEVIWCRSHSQRRYSLQADHCG